MSKPPILYYAPTACSIAPHIALEEIGVAFEPRRIDLAKGEQASPEFMALSPLGRVPTMIIDGEAVTVNTPVHCTIRPRALRVLLPRNRPGVPPPRPRIDWTRLWHLAFGH